MRGVNKLVMEVKSDNDYFEKALLFLKPGNEDLSQREISDHAEQMLKKIKNNKQKKKSTVLNAFLWSSAGAFFMWLLMHIINFVS